jgi:hypothetical protein
MSVRVDPALLRATASLVSAPAPRACEDQNFELPTRLFAAMALMLFGFLAILAVGLSSPGLVVPMAINFIFLAAFFAVPAIFVTASGKENRALRWSEFMDRGVITATGHASGAEAAVLMLMLPFFILCWSIAIVMIAATV